MKTKHAKPRRLKKKTLRDKRRSDFDFTPNENIEDQIMNVHGITPHINQPNRESGYYHKSRF